MNSLSAGHIVACKSSELTLGETPPPNVPCFPQPDPSFGNGSIAARKLDFQGPQIIVPVLGPEPSTALSISQSPFMGGVTDHPNVWIIGTLRTPRHRKGITIASDGKELDKKDMIMRVDGSAERNAQED